MENSSRRGGEINMGLPLAPCKNCQERTIEPNCHSTCEKYLKYVELCKKFKKEQHDYRRNNYSLGNSYRGI